MSRSHTDLCVCLHCCVLTLHHVRAHRLAAEAAGDGRMALAMVQLEAEGERHVAEALERRGRA